MDSPRSASIGQLFHACDLDGSGYIDESELSTICSDLTGDEVGNVFRELDRDGDGRISIREFQEGYNGIQASLLRASRGADGSNHPSSQRKSQENHTSPNRRRYDLANSRESSEEWDEQGPVKRVTLRDVVGTLDDSFGTLTCQEQVCEMYQALHAAELPVQLVQFEDIVLSVIRDIRQHQSENERLERSFQREKEQQERHLRQLEEEMEGQMARVEARVRKQEAERQESEKDELRQDLEREIQDLQANLKKLQNLGEIAQTERCNDDTKSRMEDLVHENRYMKSQLTDAQTSLAIIRSEMATVKQQNEEKSYELETEKTTMLEYIKEQDNLTRQVHLLHDANKKLHDTNDDLRSSLESHRATSKRPHTLPPRHTPRGRKAAKDAYVNQYLSTPSNGFAPAAANMMGNNSLADELSMIQTSGNHMLPHQDSCEVDSMADDIDSGHSTMRENHDVDSEYEPASIDDEGSIYTPLRKRNRLHRVISEFDSTTESELPESTDEHENDDIPGVDGSMETEVEVDDDEDQMGSQDLLAYGKGRENRPCSSCSHSSSQSSSRRPKRRTLPITPQKPITREAERMYKIVLAGDAAVGKSSFIMRLCKDKFVNNLSSTLGVDFQTKTLEVDGRVIALQLWDTAGQERFRSIAKSYFRRADGVLLLYDTSYEKSFISVRDWVEAVEDGAQKKIPIMLLGNKKDLRDEREGEGKRCVKTEDGQRVAKDMEALFLETSAKEGDNIVESVTELARMLMTNEDLEVNAVGMKLHDIALEKGDKKTACCSL